MLIVISNSRVTESVGLWMRTLGLKSMFFLYGAPDSRVLEILQTYLVQNSCRFMPISTDSGKETRERKRSEETRMDLCYCPCLPSVSVGTTPSHPQSLCGLAAAPTLVIPVGEQVSLAQVQGGHAPSQGEPHLNFCRNHWGGEDLPTLQYNF